MTDRESYDAGHTAGHTAGGIDARLAGHDAHFARINGSLADVARELAAVKLTLQRLADSADADRRTVITTAVALKEAEDARRSTTTDRWSPWQRGIALIGAAGALAALIALILTHGGTR